MSETVICTYNEVSSIANAIREKTGTTETMYMEEMPTMIANIETGVKKISILDAVITLASSSFTWDGTEKTQEVASVVLNGETLENGVDYVVIDNSAVSAGTHTLTVIGILDYDGAITKDWTIAKMSLTKPTVSGSYTYTGSTQTVSVSNFNSSYEIKGGTYSAINAGTYNVTFSLKDTNNTQWSDSTTADFSVSWTINKANGSISASPTSVSIVGAGKTATSTITYSGDGSISVATSSSGVATATRSGSTITITAVGSGSATITVSIAEGTNHKAASCSISVSVSTVSSTLSANSWATIQEVASAGTGANYWNVGDRIGVALNGTVGIKSFSGTCYAYIIGFNHNSSIEGKGIHFQFGYTAESGGVNVAFVDSKYDSYITSSSFNMNYSSSNSGGWASSKMRAVICNSFLSALPTALQNVIANTTKYTDNTGGGSNTSSYVTSTSDKIFLLSEYEVQGSRSYANSAEQNYQAQYAYYSNGNSKVKYKENSTADTCWWWLRSPYSSGSGGFCGVSADGYASVNSANRSRGFAPGFRVA